MGSGSLAAMVIFESKYKEGLTVAAFLTAMEIMIEQFPGAFSGYSLEDCLLLIGELF
ncbi:hypothetical protein Syun_029752 [Stephania yunnanensis]|uniref:Uncharacterized protein n=1 Tax=Stephania yunnanensis TaxID=152371 RepID=A0AAP0HGB4_9MAGN